MDTIREKFALVQESEPFAIAMDIDAAGLPFLQGLTPPAGSKSVEELKQIVSWAQRPFILKGIMTARSAEKALEAGASGIVVSNHAAVCSTIAPRRRRCFRTSSMPSAAR